MMRVAINGFGRIGRMVFRRIIEEQNCQLVAINASYPADTLAHLVQYDSIHGPFHKQVVAEEQRLIVDGQAVELVSERNPRLLPWDRLNVDLVIEATGKFCDREGASQHLAAGAKKVLITAPGTDEDITIVMGVNESAYDHERHHLVSNASCTTNCLAPVAKVLHQTFGIQHGTMTTVHAFTSDQRSLDNPHRDLRRARGCTQSIVPTKTGAAKALGKVIPELAGRLNGISLRIPTPNVSIVDLVVEVEQTVTREEVNRVLQEAATGPLKGILGYSEDPLVSTDYNGNDHSGVVDALLTMVMGQKQIKVLVWYDNEWGYACRVVDLMKHMMTQARQRVAI
jgi:glyceraldehyde 3-phosphate dehydrogenase